MNQLGYLRVAAPCEVSWESMSGDERVRHCSLCSLNVYNFAEMTRDEVRELLMRTEGRICGRLYQRTDGTVLTRDCPEGLRALRHRASRIAAALFAAIISLPSLAFGDTACKKPPPKFRGSKVKLEIERVATSQPAVFRGLVSSQDGTPLPGVMVAVHDEVSNREFIAVTDVKGAFSIDSLNDGLYRVEVTLAGFKAAKIEHLQMKASDVTRARVTLGRDETMTITVGIIMVNPAATPSISDPMSTTFSQQFINKLPL